MNKMNDWMDSFSLHQSLGKSPLFPKFDDSSRSQLFQDLIAELLQGILVLTPKGEILYINDSARQTLRQLQVATRRHSMIPEEIWHLCQSLIQSRHLFPSQYWRIESEVLIDASITLRVGARWLRPAPGEEGHLLLVLNDRQRSLRPLAIAEAQKYGFTARETEIWLLHRAGYTYKEMATELNITPNTVKKHILNIHTKQKAFADLQSHN